MSIDRPIDMNPEDAPGRKLYEKIRRHAFLVCCIAAVLLKIWLTLAFGMRAAGKADADDRLFVDLAEHILRGEWLGPYDRFTLAKGPFFSIWIAGMFLANIPLLLSYQLFHAIACTLLVIALKPLVKTSPARLGIFLLLLFDPSTYSAMASWVIREGIYHQLTIVILACISGMLTRLDQAPRRLAGWSVGLGVSLAAFWTTREEGVWILPAAGIVFIYSLFVIWRKRTQPFAKTAFILLPAVLAVAGVLGVFWLNLRYYGVFELVDFKSPGFVQANGALMRVKQQGTWNQYANVPKEVRLRIYPVSPAFAELQEFLEGPPGVAWGRGAEVWLVDGTPSPPDIRGGFFVWALRHAALQRGHYKDAQETEAYFARMANEINTACSDGRLECGPEHSSLMPPWRSEYMRLTARSYWKGLRMMARLDEVEVLNMPSGGPADRMLIFEDLGRARINPVLYDTSPPRLRNQAWMDQNRFDVMKRFTATYRAVSPFLTIAACVTFLAVVVLELRARSISPTLVILVALIASFAARLGILALISITSFEAMKLRYFLPLYPMLFLFWFLSIGRCAQLIFALVAKRGASSSTTPASAT